MILERQNKSGCLFEIYFTYDILIGWISTTNVI